MGLVHGRELLTGPALLIDFRAPSTLAVLLLAGALVACGSGGDTGASSTTAGGPATDSATARAASRASAGLLGELPEGAAMPPPDAGPALPPYPGARIHHAQPEKPGVRSFQAFTPDSQLAVVAFYSESLGPEWKRSVAHDMVYWQKGNDEAAITVSPWDPTALRPDVDLPAFVREAHTAIGVAWRPR